MRVCPAEERDLPEIVALYNHHVVHTPVTFDLEPFTVESRRPWFAQFSERGRYRLLVARDDHALLGYAGSLPFRAKAAYQTSVELTIYVAHDQHRRGVASALYTALFAALAGEDLHRALAGITLPNEPSVALHQRFGFRQAALFTEQGRKLGRYWDVAWFEKAL
jgi:phosphinothricin acetyltransferase